MPEESILTVYKPLINNTYHTISHQAIPSVQAFFFFYFLRDLILSTV